MASSDALMARFLALHPAHDRPVAGPDRAAARAAQPSGAAPAAGDPRRRDQRQGLDHRVHAGDPRSGRPGGPCLHLAAPRPVPRADPDRRDRRRAIRGRGSPRGRVRALRDRQCRRADHDVRDHHGGGPGAVLGVPGRRPAARGRPRRPARRHQRDRATRLCGGHAHRPRPCRVSRRYGRISGDREGRDLQARLPGGDRRPGLCRGRRRAVPARRGRGGRPDPRRQPGFLRPRGARPPRLPGRYRAVRPAAAAARRPAPAGQCRHGDHGVACGGLRRHRHEGPGEGAHRGRLAGDGSSGWAAVASPGSSIRAPSCGSTAATTSMAAASSPPPWPISASAATCRWC